MSAPIAILRSGGCEREYWKLSWLCPVSSVKEQERQLSSGLAVSSWPVVARGRQARSGIPVSTYSVEKLHGKIWLKCSRALESLQFARAEGPPTSEDISSQSISKRRTACLCLVFSQKLIHRRNLQCV
jgi:hypothetical protein